MEDEENDTEEQTAESRAEQPSRAGRAAEQPEASRERDRRPAAAGRGIELIGVYEDSGFKDPPYIAQRADGQVIQMPGLLYFVAEEVDGQRSYAEIAERVSEKLERGVSAENIQYLLDEKLRPLGVLTAADGSSPDVEKVDPLLALKFRVAAVPARATRALTTIFYPFFFPPVILAVLGGLLATDIWFFFIHGAAQSTRELLYNPLLLLMVLGLVVLATALHEIGHATATRYGGAEPGVMGAGIYVVWPAFYTDVTDAYRLSRAGRLRVDLGGVYFNAIFILGVVGAYALTGFEPLLVLVVVQHLQILQQFLPFLRLDGYYILSDLTGVPDMFQRIKPTLKSLLPWKGSHDKVEELKPWVRWAISGWVITLIPVLMLVFGLMIFNMPRMVATAWDSFWVQTERVSDSFDDGRELSGVVGVMQAGFLVLPIAGITATFVRIGKRMATGAWSWSSDSAPRRLAIVAVLGASLGMAAFIWYPNGDYRPIQPGEKGTLQGGAKQYNYISTGRPGLTKQRQEQLGGAPAESRRLREKEGLPPEPTSPGTTSTTNTDTAPTTTDTTGTTTTPTTTDTAPATTTAPEGTTTTTPTTTETAPATTTAQTTTAPAPTTTTTTEVTP